MNLGVLGGPDRMPELDLEDLIKEHAPGVVLTSTNRGIDTDVYATCQSLGIPVVTFTPNFLLDSKNSKYNPRDFFLKMRQLVVNCDKLLVVWKSGQDYTKDVTFAMELARELGLEVTEVTF